MYAAAAELRAQYKGFVLDLAIFFLSPEILTVWPSACLLLNCWYPYTSGGVLPLFV